MANETLLTIVGNTTAPAELRFTPAGAAVATFTVASTPRTFDRNTNEWKDGTTLFMRCSAWRDMAENVAETLDQKGMRVVVTGRLGQREYEKDGQKRTVIELEVDEIGPSLKYANATVNRTQRNGAREQGNSAGFEKPAAQGGWGNQSANAGGWGNGGTQESPF